MIGFYTFTQEIVPLILRVSFKSSGKVSKIILKYKFSHMKSLVHIPLRNTFRQITEPDLEPVAVTFGVANMGCITTLVSINAR